MPVFATDSQRFSAVVKYEDLPHLSVCRESVVINDAAGGTYAVGAVLGKITASGKYTLLNPAAADGSQNFAGIYIMDGLGHSKDLTVAAATDTKAIVLARGHAIVAKEALSFHANVDQQAEKDAVYAAMKAVNIQAEASL